MASKRSFFNGTLLRKNILRFWPVWAGTLLLAVLLLPVNLGNQLSHNAQWLPERLTAARTAGMVLDLRMVVIGAAFVLGMVVAALVHHYLFTARSAQFMHALPIRREGLLLTNVAAGIIILWAPVLLTAALTLAVEAAWGVVHLYSLWQLLALYLSASLLFFAMGTLSMYLTGMLPAAIGLYLAMNFVLILCYEGLQYLMERLVLGYAYNGGALGIISFLTPFVNLASGTNVQRWYDDQTNELLEQRMQGMDLLWQYALLGVVLLGVTLLLSRSRKTERASDLLAYSGLRPVFKVCAAVLGGGLAALLTLELYDLDGFWATLLCFLAWSLVAWLVAEMLVRKSLKVFHRKQFAQWSVLAVCIVLLLGCAELDVFGIVRRVPEPERVESVYVSAPGASGSFDDAAEVVELHQALVSDLDALRSVNRTGGMFHNVSITYELDNGRTLSRQYRVPRAETGEPKSAALQALIAFCAKPENVLQLTLDGGLNTMEQLVDLRVESLMDPETGAYSALDLNRSESWKLYEAVERDIRAGNYKIQYYGIREEQRYLPINLDLSYYSEATLAWMKISSNPLAVGSEWFGCRVSEDMEYTIACLRELSDQIDWAVIEEYTEIG